MSSLTNIVSVIKNSIVYLKSYKDIRMKVVNLEYEPNRIRIEFKAYREWHKRLLDWLNPFNWCLPVLAPDNVYEKIVIVCTDVEASSILSLRFTKDSDELEKTVMEQMLMFTQIRQHESKVSINITSRKETKCYQCIFYCAGLYAFYFKTIYFTIDHK